MSQTDGPFYVTLGDWKEWSPIRQCHFLVLMRRCGGTSLGEGHIRFPDEQSAQKCRDFAAREFGIALELLRSAS